MMLTELCRELNNWFDRYQPKINKTFTVADGLIEDFDESGIKVGQYYRIIGSVFNDGVHKYTGTADSSLKDEEFCGSVWLMAIPQDALELADEIEDWVEKYKDVSASPFASENLSATSYSYSVNTSAGSGSGASWQNIFSARLTKWRRMRP